MRAITANSDNKFLIRIFSSIRPDWRLVKLLASLEAKNTDALIGGVAKILADEGITLTDSTLLLKDLLASEGVLTRRKPSSTSRSTPSGCTAWKRVLR